MTLTGALTPIFDKLTSLAEQGTTGLVIMDLDSTALSTSARQHRILLDFANQHSDPVFLAAVRDIHREEIGFLIETPLQRRGIDDPDLFLKLRRFWVRRFFTNAYCRLDIPNPGAPELARAIVERGGLVYYLTARPRSMYQGTIDVLGRHGFPVLRGRAILHMKPELMVDDANFKAEAMAEIASLGHPVVATFENEPKHAHTYLEAFPDATHVLVGSIRSPRAPDPDPRLIALPGFVD
ncbi:MAG: hypothetical protein AAGA48_07785 [Myxococcota bacterium]